MYTFVYLYSVIGNILLLQIMSLWHLQLSLVSTMISRNLTHWGRVWSETRKSSFVLLDDFWFSRQLKQNKVSTINLFNPWQDNENPATLTSGQIQETKSDLASCDIYPIWVQAAYWMKFLSKMKPQQDMKDQQHREHKQTCSHRSLCWGSVLVVFCHRLSAGKQQTCGFKTFDHIATKFCVQKSLVIFFQP